MGMVINRTHLDFCDGGVRVLYSELYFHLIYVSGSQVDILHGISGYHYVAQYGLLF